MRYSVKPVRSSIKIVHDLFAILDKKRLSALKLSEIIGIHNVTISLWRSGRSTPNLRDFENAANELGYRLKLEKIDASDPDGFRRKPKANRNREDSLQLDFWKRPSD